MTLILVLVVIGVFYVGYICGHSGGRLDGIREYYFADQAERAALILETRA